VALCGIDPVERHFHGIVVVAEYLVDGAARSD